MEENITVTKGQLVYWVRKSTEAVESVRVHSVQSDYFTALELKGQRTFLFNNSALGEIVFIDPVEADEKLELLKPVWKSQQRIPDRHSLSYMLQGLKDSDDD